MSTRAILGLQWGDEGKGKLVDSLCAESDVCVRFQGGGNAGHTIYPEGGKIVLHHLPTGVLHASCINIMGPGMVVDPERLVEEIDEIQSRGLDLSDRLYISDRISVTAALHLKLDVHREENDGRNKVGSTRRGIGPTYADRYDRIGVRMIDLLNRQSLHDALERALAVRATQLGGSAPSLDEMLEPLLKAGARLQPHISDTSLLLAKALKGEKRIVFEGAQGAMLDVAAGTYPYVTSSHTLAYAIPVGVGLAVNVDEVIGVTKAYCTRVGEGPFPTELNNPTGERLREAGGEFGATTGRPRRTGWIDLFALRYVCKLSGVTRLAVTKLDVLSGMGDIQAGVGYEDYDRPGMPADILQFSALKPIYRSFDGWDEEIGDVRNTADLPANARRFLRFIEEFVGVKIGLISVGPGREEVFKLDGVGQD